MNLVQRAVDPLTGDFQDLTGSNRWRSAKCRGGQQQVTQTETNIRTEGSSLPFLLAAGLKA